MLNPGATNLARKQLLTETEYRKAVDDNRDLPVIDGTNQTFIAKMGGEAIKELLLELDLDQMSQGAAQRAQGCFRPEARQGGQAPGSGRILPQERQPSLLDDYGCRSRHSPELRPMVQLDGGRFATSDLNDLYRRVISTTTDSSACWAGRARYHRAQRKRMLQEAVDALIDNGRRGRPVTGPGNRALKVAFRPAQR